MRLVYLIVVLSLVACSEKPTGSTESSTPVADQWLLNIDEFIESECGGVYDSACVTLFYYEFQADLIEYYDLDPSLMKDCSLYPSVCTEPREMELHFSGI
jgi:hypothetical protein